MTLKRKKYRLLQEWEVQAVLDAYRDGEKLAAIAAEFNVHESTIVLQASKNGLNMRSALRKKQLDGDYKCALKNLKNIPLNSNEYLRARRMLGKMRDENAKKRQAAKANR